MNSSSPASSSDQLDLFGGLRAVQPAAPADATGLVYTIVARGGRFGITWRCGSQAGVVGGLYATADEAERGIAFRRELRAQGIQDPRPWMRVPPEGAEPRQ